MEDHVPQAVAQLYQVGRMLMDFPAVDRNQAHRVITLQQNLVRIANAIEREYRVAVAGSTSRSAAQEAREG